MFQKLAELLLDPMGLTPHGFCLLWEPGLIWTYAVSDLATAVAYFTIPLALAVFARRRSDLVFRPIFWLFASFILLCGTTHVLDVITLWAPAYRLEALVKVLTASVSIVTAFALWRILPQALSLPSHRQLELANLAMRESEARYRASFDNSPIPMHMLNADGVVTGVSRSWQSLFGYDAAEAIGRHITEFQQPGSEGWAESDLTPLRAGGEIRDVPRQYLRRDGAVLDILLSSRWECRDGTDWMVCVVIDVTERRRTEKALRSSEERLHQAQKMEAVGHLTGGIAHDFNNMLQSVTGGLEMVERRIAQGRSHEVGPYIATARKAADHAAALTNRMLAFARRQALQPTFIEPDKLLLGMQDLLRSALNPSIRLELKLLDGKWSTVCDATQLESALLNLALNGRDAMPDGGVLTIITADQSLTAADLVDQDDVEPGDYVEIVVADTGAGMEPQVLRQAFQPFFTTRPFGQGSGLGLSQVYGFVRQSDGFVTLESEAGCGTTVRLYLPRRDRPGAAAHEDYPAASVRRTDNGETTAATVLVVEDEERIRHMIVTLLEGQGYTIIEADDGPSGLRVVRSAVRLDLLLTDVGLPGLNGRQLADAAREGRPDLPVLFITGYAGTVLDERGLPPGMEVLRKPFALDDFRARVQALTAGRILARQDDF